MPCPFKGGSGFAAVFVIAGKIRTELYIDYVSPEAVTELFAFLVDRKAEIEAVYGGPLEWEELENRRASRIADYRPGDVTNDDAHEEYLDWFFDTGTRLRKALEGPAREWLIQSQS
jgi:hypothetical protein